MKLCRDCRWVSVQGGWYTRLVRKLAYGDSFPSYARCSHPMAFFEEPIEVHPVTGMEKVRVSFASTARLAHMPCGDDAKLFESHVPKD